MKIQFDVPVKISDLWRWDGAIGRGPYAVLGVVLFALKHNLDRLVASYGFGREWSVFNYLTPVPGGGLAELSAAEATFLGAMVALALPFIWTGVVLTLRRLRSAALPSWLVALFFVPFVNLLFFVVLSVLPARDGKAEDERPHSGTLASVLDRVIPDHPLGSAAMGILVVLLLALAGTLFSVRFLEAYGSSLFVGIPFFVGFASVLLHGYHRPRRLRSSMAVAFLAIGHPSTGATGRTGSCIASI